MSHFTCLVIGKGVADKLAPYNEELEVEPHKRYIERKRIEQMVVYYKEHEKEEERRELDINDLPNSIAPLWEDYTGRTMELGEDGKPFYWSTSNPNSKWDWYQMGGRWQGSLRLKYGKEGVQGKIRMLTEYREFREEYVDQAEFKDIDWEYMRNDPELLLELKWHWKETMAEKGFSSKEYLLEKYVTEQEYFRSNLMFSTYATITKDSEWHEPGQMGAWAMTTATPEEEKSWGKSFWERFLEGLDPETQLTVVDCHI